MTGCPPERVALVFEDEESTYGRLESLADGYAEPAWDVRETGWHVDIRFPFPIERMAEMTPGYTANRAVNSVPYVVAAAPGIRTTADLPQIIAALGEGPA